jgi:hypothetical protein
MAALLAVSAGLKASQLVLGDIDELAELAVKGRVVLERGRCQVGNYRSRRAYRTSLGAFGVGVSSSVTNCALGCSCVRKVALAAYVAVGDGVVE